MEDFFARFTTVTATNLDQPQRYTNDDENKESSSQGSLSPDRGSQRLGESMSQRQHQSESEEEEILMMIEFLCK